MTNLKINYVHHLTDYFENLGCRILLLLSDRIIRPPMEWWYPPSYERQTIQAKGARGC